MDIQAMWEKALAETDIIRSRLKTLSSTQETKLPYLFLAPSCINQGDTLVRRGEVLVDKPMIIMPNHSPQFGGFDFDKNFEIGEELINNFLLIRGVRFPSLKFDNYVSSVDLFEGGVDKAIESYGNQLQRQEDIATTLLVGPEEAWQFSVLIYIGMQVGRSAGNDLQSYLDAWKKKRP